jgi:hypothetical protein
MQKWLDSMEKKFAANNGSIPDTILTDGSPTQGSNSNNAALTHQNWPWTGTLVWVIGDVSCITINESNTDLDSHTNQSLLGSNTSVIHNFDKPVNIIGYNPRGPVTHSLHTISGALAYDCPDTGATFILIVHQAIHNPKCEHNLLSPFQMSNINQSILIHINWVFVEK